MRDPNAVDPAYPDLVGIVGKPMIPCKVVELVATSVPTERIEGDGRYDAHWKSVPRYVIRYQPAPVVEVASERQQASGSLGPDAPIRATLAGWRLNVESLRKHGADLIALDALMEAQAAIGAVLDLHAPRGSDSPYLWCGSCRGDSWPCPTVCAIAEKLGVEVDDART